MVLTQVQKKVKTVKMTKNTQYQIAARKALYRDYTHLGNYKYRKGYGNFITYATKAEKIFAESSLLENRIHDQVKAHWKKINDRLR